MPSVQPVLHFTYSCKNESINQLVKSKKHLEHVLIISAVFFFSGKQDLYMSECVALVNKESLGFYCWLDKIRD